MSDPQRGKARIDRLLSRSRLLERIKFTRRDTNVRNHDFEGEKRRLTCRRLRGGENLVSGSDK